MSTTIQLGILLPRRQQLTEEGHECMAPACVTLIGGGRKEVTVVKDGSLTNKLSLQVVALS